MLMRGREDEVKENEQAGRKCGSEWVSGGKGKEEVESNGEGREKAQCKVSRK